MTIGGDPDVSPIPTDDSERRPRSPFALSMIFGLAALVFAGFVALGMWQVHRRTWKLALIDQVTHRIHAAPVAAPGPAAWRAITAERDAYRHVVARGRYDKDRETLVQANTELGPGFWVLTPFQTAGGFTVLVNRGFVPTDHRSAAARIDGQIDRPTTVTGLLRITEPKGAFLRDNDPARDRWYSRDVATIAAARHLGTVAPYFIDADRAMVPADAPIGGLTVITFPNNHLQYAITWFALAILTLIGISLLVRDERQLRRPVSRSRIAAP